MLLMIPSCPSRRLSSRIGPLSLPAPGSGFTPTPGAPGASLEPPPPLLARFRAPAFLPGGPACLSAGSALILVCHFSISLLVSFYRVL